MCVKCIEQAKEKRNGKDGVPEAFEDAMLYLSEISRNFIAAKQLFATSSEAPTEIFEEMEHLALSAASRFGDAARFRRTSSGT